MPKRLYRIAVRIALATIALTLTFSVLAPPTAEAQPARVVAVRELSPQVSLVSVYSPSMNRVIRSHVLHPVGSPAGLPSFYLLGGVGGAEDGISWYNFGHVREFFAGKRVNVVLPIGGKFSMMTDWQRDDPILGRNKWQTFFTRELPAAIDATFRTSGRNAIGGVSMSAGPVLDLAIQAPNRFQGVAAYSGCPGSSDPLGRLAGTVLPLRGGGNPINMWGPPESPAWRQHDPVLNADKLRGKAIFLSAGSGLPGPIDGGPVEAIGGLFGGSALEAIALQCTNNMSRRLDALGIAHTVVRRPDGSHSWGLFSADMRLSWPLMARAIGAR